jgi:hypothetical protein
MEVQKWVPSALLSSYRMLSTAVDSMQVKLNSTYTDVGYTDRQLSGSAWPFW